MARRTVPDETEIVNIDNWGKLDNRPQQALDTRSEFLLGNPSWYLYFWKLADSFQLLDSAMQRLSGKVGLASGTHGSTVSSKKRKSTTSGVSLGDTNEVDGTEAMGRINLLLDRFAETDESEFAMRQETLRLGMESIVERRQDRVQEKDLAIRRNMQEKELAIRNRMGNLNDSIDDLEKKMIMEELTDGAKKGIEKVISKKQNEVQKLEAELVSCRQHD